MPNIERAVAQPDPNARGHSAYTQAGWVCPQCHKVWSPYIRTCYHCGRPPQAQAGPVERRGL